MQYKDILLHLSADGRTAEKVEFATRIAARFGANLTALYTIPFLTSVAYMGEYVPAEFYQQQMDAARDAAEKARAIFEREAGSLGLQAGWMQSEQSPYTVIPEVGRCFDLLIAGQDHPDTSIWVSENADISLGSLALDLGRPVLALPYAGSHKALAQTAMIAWNGSREAARAVHDALPLLQEARSVIVFSINPTPDVTESAATLVKHLVHHGVPAVAKHAATDDIEDGEALLSALVDEDVNLLVMGVYGHSRVREMILGGVSRNILDSMTVPVLMSC